MSDVEQSPEFQAALDKACEAEYNTYLFGDRRKAKTAEKLPESVREALKESNRIRREAEAMRHRAESQMHGSMGGMFSTPTMPSLPDNPSREDGDRYRAEVDTYTQQVRNQSQMMSDPSIQRGLERFKMSNQGLQCPECHDVDHNNRMMQGGKSIPYCVKCNCALESPSKKGKKQPRIKRAEKKVPNILRGLPEDG